MTTAQLAEYAQSLRYDQLPAEVVAKAKEIILDTVACGLGGSRSDPVRALDRLVAIEGGRPQASLLGAGEQTSPGMAAFRNAVACNILDYCDTYLRLGHYASTIVPAALAMAEATQANGKDLIAAVVAAYDVTARIGVAIHPSPDRFTQVWGVGTHQVFGAAVAAGRLAGLQGEEFLYALGLAGVSAPLPSAFSWNWDQRPLSWHKDSVHWPAAAGVHAVHLAQSGFVGPRSVLDGERGFWAMSGSDRFAPEELTRGLGTEYRILETSIKPYSNCRWIHPVLDAVRHIVAETGLRAEDVLSVDVESFYLFEHYGFMDPRPGNMIDAEFSVPYGVAMVLLGKDPGPDWYEPHLFTDEEVLRLQAAVSLRSTPEMNELYEANYMPARVTIRTKGGAAHTHEVRIARGDPRNPLTDEELEAKARRLAGAALDAGNVDALVAEVNRLEQADSLQPLCELLRGS